MATLRWIIEQELKSFSKDFTEPTRERMLRFFQARYDDYFYEDRSVLPASYRARLESDLQTVTARIQMWEQIQWIGIPLILSAILLIAMEIRDPTSLATGVLVGVKPIPS